MPSTDLCFLSAVEMAQGLRRRDFSTVELIDAHLARIERINPAVNAIVTLTPDTARAEARAADALLARGGDLPALHGLPVAHKDLALTRGVRTTFGSPIFRDFVPDQDALVVARQKHAGAITLGKTNTPEFGAGSQTFNPVFGPTRNPYDPARTCGGSSGGAAVALACGMVPLADGSDLGGSLRNPASFCNVVGLRPSPGRVPSWPVDAPWFPLSVEGPMARSVADAAFLLSVLAGPDARSPIALDEPGESFRRPLQRDFRGTRVAWCAPLPFPVDGRVRTAVDAVRPVFESLGCATEEAMPDMSEADEIFQVLRAWRMELSFGELLDRRRADMKDTVIWNIEQGRALTGAQVGAAERRRGVLWHRVRTFMERYEFMVLPVAQVPPFEVEVPYVTSIDGTPMPTYIDWMKSCYMISVLGLPALSVPCGFTPEGLPVGIQIVGRHRDDFGVLQLGHAFELATRVGQRRPALAA